MSEEKYFKTALASMAADFAYVDAIRHLYDDGLSPEQIVKELMYPVSMDRIREVIAEYEKEKNSPDAGYEYVQQTDEYGRRSFVRVKK